MLNRRNLIYFLLVIILLLGFILRLHKIDRPLADRHSWRQADTATVSRNYIKDGFNIFLPRFDDLSSSGSQKDNPNGYRLVEFPIYNLLVAVPYLIFGVNLVTARLVSIFLTLGSAILLFFLVKRFLNSVVALLSALFFLTIPYYIFYSTTILPEQLMIFSQIGTLLFFSLWMEKDKDIFRAFLAILFFALAILTKPFSIFLLLPLFYLAWIKYDFGVFKKWNLWIYLLAVSIPFAVWRFWISHFPEGIPLSAWLLNGSNIRFTGAFWHWIFAERIGKEILAYGGLVLFCFGLILKPIKNGEWLFHLWFLSVLIYFIVVATGNVTHDYYQIPFIPVASVFLACGFYYLWRLPHEHFIIWLGPILAIMLILMFWAFGWYEARDYYNINDPKIVEAGTAADQILPKNSKVIAPYGGDTSFLYQINRKGWPILEGSVDDMIKKGATNFVTVDPNDFTPGNVLAKYKIIKKTKDYLILDLLQKNQ